MPNAGRSVKFAALNKLLRIRRIAVRAQSVNARIAVIWRFPITLMGARRPAIAKSSSLNQINSRDARSLRLFKSGYGIAGEPFSDFYINLVNKETR